MQRQQELERELSANVEKYKKSNRAGECINLINEYMARKPHPYFAEIEVSSHSMVCHSRFSSCESLSINFHELGYTDFKTDFDQFSFVKALASLLGDDFLFHGFREGIYGKIISIYGDNTVCGYREGIFYDRRYVVSYKKGPSVEAPKPLRDD